MGADRQGRGAPQLRSEVAAGPALAAALSAVLLVVAAVEAEEPAAAPEPEPERPGLFRLGPVYLTPRLRIGTVGLDSNVFYTAKDRRTDLTASGGPGLDLVLPAGRSLRLRAGGGLDYVHFVRTASQRKLGGVAEAGADWTGGRIQAGVREAYSRTFQRPSFEVDRRVLQDQWTTSGELTVKAPGRLGVRAVLSRSRFDVGPDQDFAGADLHAALARTQTRGGLGVEYALTPKTFVVLEGDHELHRFDVDPGRDADSNRLCAGVRVASKTRLSGRAVAGVRLFRPKAAGRESAVAAYAAAELAYRLGPRTRMTASYGRDLHYSAFETTGATPTLSMEAYSARVEKGLVGRLELHLFGRLTRFRTDGAVRVEGSGGPVTAVRRDSAWEEGVDLGYRFRSKLRLGVAVVYTDRGSTIADFGIHGLLVGGTLSYDPGRP